MNICPFLFIFLTALGIKCPSMWQISSSDDVNQPHVGSMLHFEKGRQDSRPHALEYLAVAMLRNLTSAAFGPCGKMLVSMKLGWEIWTNISNISVHNIGTFQYFSKPINYFRGIFLPKLKKKCLSSSRRNKFLRLRLAFFKSICTMAVAFMLFKDSSSLPTSSELAQGRIQKAHQPKAGETISKWEDSMPHCTLNARRRHTT